MSPLSNGFARAFPFFSQQLRRQGRRHWYRWERAMASALLVFDPGSSKSWRYLEDRIECQEGFLRHGHHRLAPSDLRCCAMGNEKRGVSQAPLLKSRLLVRRTVIPAKRGRVLQFCVGFADLYGRPPHEVTSLRTCDRYFPDAEKTSAIRFTHGWPCRGE
jgi:hypothetical protein